MNKKIKVVVVIGIAFMLFACKSRQYAVVQKISLNNDSLKLCLPRNAQKLTNDGLRLLEQQRFNDTITYKILNDVYDANGIIIGLFGIVAPGKDAKSGLDGLQGAFERLYASSPQSKYSDKMITMGSNRILVMSFQRKKSHDVITTGYYRFYVANSNISFNMSGLIQFNIDQKETATAILDDVIKSIQFKQ